MSHNEDSRDSYLFLLWEAYQDTAEDAREALRQGDKLQALCSAVLANKLRQKYLYEASWY